MSPEVVSIAVREYFAALRAMDRQAWVATFAEDAVSYDPVGAPPTKGHQALGSFFDAVMGRFKEVGLTEEDIFVAGNGAAVKWRGRGVSKGGHDVNFEGIDVFTINEAGKIETVHAYWNPAEMIAQL